VRGFVYDVSNGPLARNQVGLSGLNLTGFGNTRAYFKITHIVATALLNCRNQAITRFDRWSVSVTAMFRQQPHVFLFCRVLERCVLIVESKCRLPSKFMQEQTGDPLVRVSGFVAVVEMSSLWLRHWAGLLHRNPVRTRRP
jgi:hypothetical protein